jgi:hypothetical protein
VIDRLNAVNTSPSVRSMCSDIPTCVISGFRRDVSENCTLLRNCAAITTTRCVITRKSAFLRYTHLFLTTFKRVRYVSDEPCKCFRLHSAFRFLGGHSVLGHAVAQFLEALRYKPKGRGFDSRWCHWNFSLTVLLAAQWPWS